MKKKTTAKATALVAIFGTAIALLGFAIGTNNSSQPVKTVTVRAVGITSPSCDGVYFHMQCIGQNKTLIPGVSPVGVPSGAFGVDFYGATLSAAFAKSHGAKFGAGYLSYVPGKDLTRSLVANYKAAGLGTVSVFEQNNTQALNGYAQGINDAKLASQEAASLGEPSNRPICFAVDTDTTWQLVAAYFQGVNSVIGKSRDCAYGGYFVVTGLKNAGIVTYMWQTLAWSHGYWVNSCPSLIQTSINDYWYGANVDYDTTFCKDYGQWFYTPPKPNPTLYQMLTTTVYHLGNISVSERSTVESWDKNRCENPVRRGICVRDNHAILLLRNRVWYVAHHPAINWTLAYRGVRWQALNLRLYSTVPTTIHSI